MEIDYNTGYHSFSNQYSIYGASSFFREKHQEKSNKIKKHHEEIFNVYTDWVNKSIAVDIDLLTFDPNRLCMGISEQIVPINTSSNGKLTSLWSKAISHLNCDNYIDVHNKFEEIECLEKEFNKKMDGFLRKHCESLEGIVREEFHAIPEFLIKLFRYILRKAISQYERPLVIGNRLDEFTTFKILIDKTTNESIEFSNPFPNKEKELIEFLKNNYKEIVKSIKEFQNDIEKVETYIREFKEQLFLLNKIDLMD